MMLTFSKHAAFFLFFVLLPFSDQAICKSIAAVKHNKTKNKSENYN